MVDQNLQSKISNMEIESSPIFYTEDYSIFKKLFGNRVVNRNHVKTLVLRIRKDGRVLDPVVINEHYEVIDGQHRLESCKILGIAVPYEIRYGYGITEARSMNAGRSSWSGMTYTRSCAETGIEGYVKFMNFHNKFKHFGFVDCLMLLNNSTNYTRKRKETDPPEARIFDEETWIPKSVKVAEDWAVKITAIKPYFKKGFAAKNFVTAMIKMFRNEIFDYKHFMNRVKAERIPLKKCANTYEYMVLINKIYNYGKRGGKVDLLAGERRPF